MWSTFWLAFYALAVLITLVCYWGPDPQVMTFGSVLNIGLWYILGNGMSTAYTLTQTGAHIPVSSTALTYVCFIFGFAHLPTLFLGIYEWYAGTEDERAGENQSLSDIEEHIHG